MSKLKGCIFLLLIMSYVLLSVSLISATQTYLNESEQWQGNLTAIYWSSLISGDIDNDGDSDLIAIGFCGTNCYSSKVYINNGTSLVENSTWQQNLTKVNDGSLALGDIDNDGDLDLGLIGCSDGSGGDINCNSGGHVTKIYLNNGTSFTESSQWQQNLTQIHRGSLEFGDIDNDGDLDLIATGKDEYNSKRTFVYLNNGTSLVESFQWQSNLINIVSGCASLGDIDNDGDLDLGLCGDITAIPYRTTKIYLNNGTSFVEDSTWKGDLAIVGHCQLSFSDFDNDGDLDINLIGCCDKHISYRNNGSAFSEFQTHVTQGGPFIGVFDGSISMGDYDNDGDLDIASNGNERYTTIYLNNGSGNFSDYSLDPESDILNLEYDSSVIWLDLDNDNDLDLIETGYNGSEAQTKIYLSNRSLTKNNTPPNPPSSSFSSDYSDGVLNLSWGSANDTETPTDGLYYNLMVGNETQNHTIVSGIYGGSSNPTAGYFGNMMQRKNISLNKYLSAGDYYWYVQTIDTGLAKSNWSNAQSFSIGADTSPPNISSISSSVTHSTATITWTTNESANSTVYYGKTNTTTSSSSSDDLVISHSISLSSLSASTLYYYNVSSCDYWNNCNTSIQYNFTTSATPPPGNGGPGGGSPTTTITPTPEVKEFDIDFSTEDSGILEVEQGDIKTFSFQGEVKHSITILTITSNSITLLITSDPITIQININEIKQIDINSDGINDLEIRLDSITNGKAKFTIRKLSGADIVAQEELEKEALFDVKISISNLFKIIKSGREVIAEIEVFNVNNIGQVDVLVDYHITSKKDNQTILTQGSDTLAVEAVASFVRSLTVPYDVKSGIYYFNVAIKYQDKIMASGIAEFRVIRNYEIIIGVGIIVLIVVGIFFYLWRIKRKEEKLEKREKRDVGLLKKEIGKLKKRKKKK